jgi:hypothetical protein
MSKINNVIFQDSELLGEDSKRFGFIQRIDGMHTYTFKVVCEAETPEMISYMEETDFSLYEDYILDPKTGNNDTGVTWFNNLKTVTDRLNA